MGGVKVVQLCTEPCHFLAESVSVLTITAKVSRLILIGWDSGASRLAGLDHMHTPWSCEGLESAVPQLHGQRPRELRFPPSGKWGAGQAKPSDASSFPSSDSDSSCCLALGILTGFFLPQGTSRLLSGCWVLGLLFRACPSWGCLTPCPRPELVFGCWDQKFAPQGMVSGAEGVVESLSFSSGHLPVILSGQQKS